MPDLFAIGDYILIAATAGAYIFTISYAGAFNWKLTTEGRTLLYVFASLAVVLTLNALARFLGTDYWGREWIRIVVYAVFLVLIVRLIYVLWANWRRRGPGLIVPTRSNSGE